MGQSRHRNARHGVGRSKLTTWASSPWSPNSSAKQGLGCWSERLCKGCVGTEGPSKPPRLLQLTPSCLRTQGPLEPNCLLAKPLKRAAALRQTLPQLNPTPPHPKPQHSPLHNHCVPAPPCPTTPRWCPRGWVTGEEPAGVSPHSARCCLCPGAGGAHSLTRGC